MINHVRTLLLNRDATSTSLSDYGYEYIPPDYRACRLPTRTEWVRRALFGAIPDIAGLNYRLRQYMALLHSPELVSYVVADDARLTYNPYDNRPFAETHMPLVTWLSGNMPVNFVIEPGALQSRSGRLQYRWLCFGNTEETYDPDNAPRGSVALPPSWVGGLSAPIPLPESDGIFLQLGGSGTVPQDTLQVTLIKQPAMALADIPAYLERVLVEDVTHELFRDTPPEWADWWTNETQLHLRLGGVLLALAKRVDAARRGA